MPSASHRKLLVRVQYVAPGPICIFQRAPKIDFKKTHYWTPPRQDPSPPPWFWLGGCPKHWDPFFRKLFPPLRFRGGFGFSRNPLSRSARSPPLKSGGVGSKFTLRKSIPPPFMLGFPTEMIALIKYFIKDLLELDGILERIY